MRCLVLASGSKGNCLYIEGGSGAVLVDAGLSYRETALRLERAGGHLDRIQAILVTHEHADHLAGLDAVAGKLKVPVYGTEGTLSEYLRTRRTSKRFQETDVCRFGETLKAGAFQVEAFATSHDALEPCGFIVRENDLSVACCTDTGEVTPGILEGLRRCDAVVLESNHCPVMLREGPYPEMLKRRIRSKRGHLSNHAAAACLTALGKEVGAVMLAHLSQVNNTPGKARSTACSGLGLFMNDVRVIVASQDGSTPESPQEILL
jgi:phosphoribosyl 1,2-cyclic phosphodiesterase